MEQCVDQYSCEERKWQRLGEGGRELEFYLLPSSAHEVEVFERANRAIMR